MSEIVAFVQKIENLDRKASFKEINELFVRIGQMGPDECVNFYQALRFFCRSQGLKIEDDFATDEVAKALRCRMNDLTRTDLLLMRKFRDVVGSF
ncbi:MAG TPA: hypothetical protein VFM02_03375 [Candidatus Paceibacterota bacterium]|nr:hypothetical protein [Candidatus Paceibacterota bacterium]